jgi:hypothetical protein
MGLEAAPLARVGIDMFWIICTALLRIAAKVGTVLTVHLYPKRGHHCFVRKKALLGLVVEIRIVFATGGQLPERISAATIQPGSA